MTIEETIAAVVESKMRLVVREEVRAALAEVGPQTSAAPSGLLTVEEVAARCHAKPKTVRAWIQSGRLVARMAGRRYLVVPGDLDRFLAGLKKNTATVENQVVRLLDGVRG